MATDSDRRRNWLPFDATQFHPSSPGSAGECCFGGCPAPAVLMRRVPWPGANAGSEPASRWFAYCGPHATMYGVYLRGGAAVMAFRQTSSYVGQSLPASRQSMGAAS